VRAAARGIWNRKSAALVRELAGLADSNRAVVHVHGFTKVLSASVIRAAVDSGLPVVATLHDYFATCPNGAFFIYPRGEICHLTPLSARCVGTHCDARGYSHKLWRVARSAVQQRFGAMPAGLSDFVRRYAGRHAGHCQGLIAQRIVGNFDQQRAVHAAREGHEHAAEPGQLRPQLAEEVLSDILAADRPRQITPKVILEATASTFGFTIDELCGTSRRRPLVNARQISMYVLKMANAVRIHASVEVTSVIASLPQRTRNTVAATPIQKAP